MANSRFGVLVSLISIVFSLGSLLSASGSVHDLLYCLESDPSTPLYTPNTASYTKVLRSTIRNIRLLSPSTPKPLLIITPLNVHQVQVAVICSRRYGYQLKVRSGGHDFGGVSYISDVPFVMLDLVNLANISVDAKAGTAWVEAGATVGQVAYRIAEKSSTYGFPMGVGTTVGVGGQFSGGGYGSLMRKYGLSADNIVDATIVNVDGKILNRKSMGEDLFWAIRGGGAVSFGVVLSWKIQLVPVPSTITIFSLDRTLEQGATVLFEKWQCVAYRLPHDLFIQVVVNVVNTTKDGQRTVQLTFRSLYLGTAEKLIHIMNIYFPELGLKREDCKETSWVRSLLFFGSLPVEGPLDALLDRSLFLISFVTKSDYVTNPIPEEGLEGMWKLLLEEDMPQLLITPYGGRMSEIPDFAIPFPHRIGNRYTILQGTYWNSQEPEKTRKHTNWVRRLNCYLTPYVSKSPRRTYVNYRDLDLGQSKNGTSTYSEAKAWGISYFNNNYNRLVKVKTMVDPDNFFRNEQSIPTCANKYYSQVVY